MAILEADAPEVLTETVHPFGSAPEKVMHFWMGAMSPMWMPFFTAASFGIGAWTLTQAMTKSADGTRFTGFKPVSLRNPWMPDEKAITDAFADAAEVIRTGQVAAVKFMMDAEEEMIEATERATAELKPHFAAMDAMPVEVAAAAMDTVADSVAPLANSEAVSEVEMKPDLVITPKPLAAKLAVAKPASVKKATEKVAKKAPTRTK